MKTNPVAANVLGTMGTICWTGQLIPQVWKTYRDKKSDGLSPLLMLIWGISSAFLGVYAVLQRLNIPLQVQPQLFGFLTLVSWGQCLYYDPRRQNKKRLTFLLVVSTMILVGALEVLLVFVSRPAYRRGVSAPVQLFGILSAVLIAIGLLPQYWEIYKWKEVLGVSYTFILVDMLGGLFNDLSLAFAEDFDGLAAASYTIVIVMDSVIIVAALILNPRARTRRRREAEAAAASEGGAESFSTTPGSTENRVPGRRQSGSVSTPPINQPSNLDIESKGDLTHVRSIEDKDQTHEVSMRQVGIGQPVSRTFFSTTTVVGDSESGRSEEVPAGTPLPGASTAAPSVVGYEGVLASGVKEGEGGNGSEGQIIDAEETQHQAGSSLEEVVDQVPR